MKLSLEKVYLLKFHDETHFNNGYDSINISEFKPKSKHDFELYADVLSKKLADFSESPFYLDFICSVTRGAIKPLKLEDTRLVETVLKVQINDLVKQGRGKKKGKGKIGLNSGGGKGKTDTGTYGDECFDDDMEDLM